MQLDSKEKKIGSSYRSVITEAVFLGIKNQKHEILTSLAFCVTKYPETPANADCLSRAAKEMQVQ